LQGRVEKPKVIYDAAIRKKRFQNDSTVLLSGLPIQMELIIYSSGG
jgi:hypothetical protein